MSKAVLALFVGIFVTFILDFFLFLGIYLNYIKPNEIDVYYNIVFADNQNIFYYLISTIFYALSLMYIPDVKTKMLIVGTSFALILIMLIPSVSVSLAESALMQKGARFQDARYIYKGDIYYNGRDKIYIYDNEVSKMLIINKKDIIK